MMIDPPEHGKWRHLLGLYFSPGRIRGMEDEQRMFARDLIEGFRQSGRCDFYSDFAAVFPTTIFLQIMGLPIAKLSDFMGWEAKILHQSAKTDPDHSIAIAAMSEVIGYFSELIAEKRADPSERAHDDIVSHAIDWRIDGEAPPDADLLSCMLLLFMAGLDTVASQLSYSSLHLATHEADRARIVAEPATIPHAVEELVRTYSIVQTGGKPPGMSSFMAAPSKKVKSSSCLSPWPTATRVSINAVAQSISTPHLRGTSVSAQARIGVWAPI